MKNVITILILFLSFCSGCGKREKIEAVSFVEQNRARLDSVFSKARQYEQSSDPRYTAYDDSLKVIESLGRDSLLRVKRLLLKCGHLARTGRVNDAIAILDQIAGVAKRNEYSEALRSVYLQYGIAYTLRGDYDLALKYMFECLRLMEEAGDKFEMATACSSIGWIYYKLGNYDLALDYYRKNLEMTGEGSVSARGQNHINMGLAFAELNNFDSALYYYASAEELYRQGSGKYDRMLLSFAKGKTYSDLGWRGKARERLTESLALSEQTTDYRFQAESLIHLAGIHLKERDTLQARKTLTRALATAKTWDLNELIVDVYRHQIALAKIEGDLDKLTEVQRIYIDQSQKLYNEKLINKISAMQVDFDERKNISLIRDQETLLTLQDELIANKRNVIVLLIVAFLLIVIILIVLFRVNAQRKLENEALDLEVRRQTAALEESNEIALARAEALVRKFDDSCLRTRQVLSTLKGLLALDVLESTAEDEKASARDFLVRINRVEEIIKKMRQQNSATEEGKASD